MTREEKLELCAMRLDGATLDQIGARFGVTGEAIRAHLQNLAAGKNTRPCIWDSCIYPNLGHRLGDMRYSVRDLAAALGVTNRVVYSWFHGDTEIKMGAIRKLLALTGLSFEQAFATEEADIDEGGN